MVVAPYTVTYDGNPHSATVTSITGVDGETGATVGTVTLSTTHTAAGTYSSDSWSLTGTANYHNIGSTTITDTINPLALTVSGTTVTKVYDGGTTAGTVTVGTITGAVSGQTPSATGAAGAYSSANVGSSHGQRHLHAARQLILPGGQLQSGQRRGGSRYDHPQTAVGYSADDCVQALRWHGDGWRGDRGDPLGFCSGSNRDGDRDGGGIFERQRRDLSW